MTKNTFFNKFLIIPLCLLTSSPVMLSQAPPAPTGAPGLPPELMMSEEELKEMMDFLATLDEKELAELEQIGRQVLTDMGINPDTLEPVAPAAQPAVPEIKEAEKPRTPVEPTIVVSPEMVKDVQILLKKLLDTLYKIQHHSISSGILFSNNAASMIADLVYYVKALDNKKLIEQLSKPAYSNLIRSLQQLSQKLERVTLPQLQVTQFEDMDNPYDLLDVAVDATQEDIAQAYNKKIEDLNPDTIRKTMTERTATESDIKRVVKEAQRSKQLLTDAYELLQDPISRERLDKERTTRINLQSDTLDQIKKTYQEIESLLEQSVRQNQLIESLEKFFLEFEPEQLKLKKFYDEAEKARRAEQEAFAKRVPQKSPPPPAERPSRPTGFPGAGAGKGISPFDFGGKGITPSTKPSAAEIAQDKDKDKKDGGAKLPKPGDKKEKKDEKEKDKDKGKKPGKKDEKDKGKKPKDEKKSDKKKKTAPEYLKTIDSNVKAFSAALQENQRLLADLPAYMHDQNAPAINDATIAQDLLAFEEKSKLGELRAELKDFNALLKEKKLSVMSQESIDAWKQFSKMHAANIKTLQKLLSSSVENLDVDNNAEIRRRFMILQGATEPVGPLKLIKQHIDKINKYVTTIDKLVTPQPK